MQQPVKSEKKEAEFYDQIGFSINYYFATFLEKGDSLRVNNY